MKYIIKDYDIRYFAGIELIGGLKADEGEKARTLDLWRDFMSLYIKLIPKQVKPVNLIGLQIYRYDFNESKMLDYYALVEIEELLTNLDEEIITKKLPQGKYISFKINPNQLQSETEKIYAFVKENDIKARLDYNVIEYLLDGKGHFIEDELCFKLRLIEERE